MVVVPELEDGWIFPHQLTASISHGLTTCEGRALVVRLGETQHGIVPHSTTQLSRSMSPQAPSTRLPSRAICHHLTPFHSRNAHLRGGWFRPVHETPGFRSRLLLLTF